MPEEKNKDEIQAAYKQGVLDQRLAGFDSHFGAINGSIERTAVELTHMRIGMTSLEHAVIKREGPIADLIRANSGRLDVLEAGLPATILTLKEELTEEIHTFRESILESQLGGSLRRAAAAGSAFAVVLTSTLTITHLIGLT